jgi:signal transduction histidine kinase/AmiR/NasT family two-component response regulator
MPYFTTLDAVWTLLSADLVFILQASFCFAAYKVGQRFMNQRVATATEPTASTDLQHLLTTMKQNLAGDMALRAAEDPTTEVGLVAQQYNRVLDAHGQALQELQKYTDRLDFQRSELELQAQQLEIARREAEEANDTKTQFLANMSHEIRTPMTSILGYVDLLLDELDPQVEADQKMISPLQVVKRNGNHLLEIINDILDISKIESGRLTAEMIDCDITELIEDVSALMRHRAEQRGLKLDVRYLTVVPQMIQTDPTRLRQILLNLIGNAIKFTTQGEVGVEIKFLPKAIGPAQIEFAISDTGIGLSADHLQQLFQPFRQADGSTTRKYGGTGLGLTISHRLAQMLGGDIHVLSELGKGSVFTLRVLAGDVESKPSGRLFTSRTIEEPKIEAQPVAVVPKSEGPAVEPKKEGSLNCRILLAEDGPDNQRLLSFILKKAGAEVFVVDNGQSAVDFALAAERGSLRRTDDPAGPFDIILMDMLMPILDGCQATQRLREAGYKRPIIALTANAMKEDRDRCFEAGCNDFCTKPVDRPKLFSIIETWVQLSRLQPMAVQTTR